MDIQSKSNVSDYYDCVINSYQYKMHPLFDQCLPPIHRIENPIANVSAIETIDCPGYDHIYERISLHTEPEDESGVILSIIVIVVLLNSLVYLNLLNCLVLLRLTISLGLTISPFLLTPTISLSSINQNLLDIMTRPVLLLLSSTINLVLLNPTIRLVLLQFTI